MDTLRSLSASIRASFSTASPIARTDERVEKLEQSGTMTVHCSNCGVCREVPVKNGLVESADLQHTCWQDAIAAARTEERG